jgi:CheY-like chemotaxis protein
MTGTVDGWLQLAELARMFGLREESIKRLAKTHGFPLRRLTPYATPGVLESELVCWLKSNPNPLWVGRFAPDALIYDQKNLESVFDCSAEDKGLNRPDIARRVNSNGPDRSSSMKTKLRILHIEQAASDGEQVRRTLEAEGIGCDIRRVETAADFVSALDEGGFDLLLVDGSSPSLDGLSALAVAREISPDTPFVSFSETLYDETAKTSLEHGATDNELKRCLFRLVPVIRRAIREAGVRRQLRRAEATLHALYEINQAVASTLDLPGVYKFFWKGSTR